MRPTESTSIGGLIVGKEIKFPDHTRDNGISTADSKEISFNKLQVITLLLRIYLNI